MTNAVRLELAEQGTLVQGVHLGAADTDIMAGYDGPMIARATWPGRRSTAWPRDPSRSWSTTGAAW
ncbi:hypothetical protein MAFF212519_31300 [Clavibacter michiganensis]